MKCHKVFYDFGCCLLETAKNTKKNSVWIFNYFPLNRWAHKFFFLWIIFLASIEGSKVPKDLLQVRLSLSMYSRSIKWFFGILQKREKFNIFRPLCYKITKKMQGLHNKMKYHQVFYDFGYCLLETAKNKKKIQYESLTISL